MGNRRTSVSTKERDNPFYSTSESRVIRHTFPKAFTVLLMTRPYVLPNFLTPLLDSLFPVSFIFLLLLPSVLRHRYNPVISSGPGLSLNFISCAPMPASFQFTLSVFFCNVTITPISTYSTLSQDQELLRIWATYRIFLLSKSLCFFSH